MQVSSRRAQFKRLLAIAGVAAIALAGCVTKPVAPPPAAPVAQPQTPAGHPLSENKPTFFNLPNVPGDHTPVRVGVILPFTSGTPSVKALAQAMLRSAQMALYESDNHDIILMTADEGATPADAAAAADRLLDQGAEIIVGPLYGPSVRAISAAARDHAVPVLAFSTERSVAGDGVYLMGFLPQNDTSRVVGYALTQDKHKFAALVPSTAFGDLTLDAFKKAVTDGKGEVGPIERFEGTLEGVPGPAGVVAKSDADAVFIPQGGPMLRAAAPALSAGGFVPGRTKLLGTGQWNETANLAEPMLSGAWFAGPDPKDEIAFSAKYRAAFGVNPPPLAALAYDAVSLVAALAKGEPYHRFTRAALEDPNGFSGADGIFRFAADGTAERGLAIIAISPDGFHVVDPAPTTFVKPGS
jgi:ABC-type branched-subunit amino acid transport system substrate-binding protein